MDHRAWLAVWAAATVMGGTVGAQAAGFALIEQNASGLGNAYAGQAAAAQDASTIFFNPAGLTEIKGRQFAGALHLILPSAEYSDNAGVPNGGAAGSLAAVPNAYYAMDLGQDLKFGLGLGSPFGLKTEYNSNWTGRANGILSDVKTININPTLAWRVNDMLSLGIGVNFQYIEAELSRGPAPGLVTTLKGDDTAWGYNLGAMFRLDEATRLGLSYRSTMDYRLEGDLSANVPALPGIGAVPQPIYANVELPDMASLAVHRRINDRWVVMADATWTGWGVFQKLEARLSSNDAVIELTNENWDDTWRFGLGASYRQDEQWTWRFGLAYDQTPVPDAAHRTPRIPDEDRTWLAVGGQYRLPGGGAIDFGYAHLFVQDAAINAPAGSYDNAVDILSAQYTHSF